MRVRVLSVLLVLSFVLGPSAVAQEPTDLSGAIGGRVTDDSGSPLQDVCVNARHADLEIWGGTYTSTRRDGTYWLTGLRQGRYTLTFNDCGRGELEEQILEDPVEVELAESTTLDVILRPLGTISGTVRRDDGAPVSEVCVSAWPVYTGGEGPVVARWAYVSTDQDGRYSMPVTDGDYRVEIRPCSEAARDLVRSWYPDGATQEQAEIVSVQGRGHVQGIDGRLPMGGRISGTVLNSEGVPVDEVCVTAEGASSYAWNETSSDGTYLIRGVEPGDLKVRFWHCPWESMDVLYAPKWYPDAPDQDSATAVTVVAGETTSGIDVTLAVGGSISGTVTRADGQSSSACAYVYDLDGRWIRAAWSDTGEYRVGGLPAGVYVVQLTDCSGGSIWWDGKSDRESADPVSVELGVERTAIDAVVPAHEPPPPPNESVEIEQILVLRDLQEEGTTYVEGMEDRSVWVDVQVSGHEGWYWSLRALLNVCPATAGSCRLVSEYVYGRPGRTSTTKLEWQPFGVGTFNLEVEARPSSLYPAEPDTETVSHDVVLRDTGVGVGL